MNSWNGIGRLTKDPDIRYTSGENSMCVARYTLAVDRRYKKEGQPTADFIQCVAMGKNGEFCERYFHKGTKIAVTGHIQTGSYTNKDGQRIYTTDVMIDTQEFCESKSSSQETAKSGATAPKADDFMDLPEDSDLGELPFR